MSYFSDEEIRCSHCHELPTGDDFEDFLRLMNTLRELCGFPLVINSWFRCKDHPIEAAKPNGPGAHSTGLAADVRVRGGKAFRVIEESFNVGGFNGIGVNQKGDTRFIHLDSVSGKPDAPRPWIWSY